MGFRAQGLGFSCLGLRVSKARSHGFSGSFASLMILQFTVGGSDGFLSTLHEQLLVVSSLDMIVKSKESMCPNSIYFGLKVFPT